MMYRYWVNARKGLSQWLVWLWIGGILCSAPALANPDDKTYSLSIVPQYTPLFIHRNWQPFVERLQKETGVAIRIKVYASFRQFLAALERGEPDFTYLAPYHLVMARRAQGYEPLVRDDAQMLVGIIVVPKHSTIASVQELEGKTIIFPSPNAFAASLYMRAWLHEQLGIKFTIRYAGTHDNVYRQVVQGIVDAGGGVNSTLESQPVNLRNNLRVLYELPAVAPHPLAAHPRVPPALRKRFTDSVLRMTADEQGRGLLEALHLMQPVKADYQRDYYPLETLGLEKYQAAGQE